MDLGDLGLKREETKTIFGLESVLTFGKHKGIPLIDAIDEYPPYFEWCIENLGWFQMDNEAYEYYVKALAEFNARKEKKDNWVFPERDNDEFEGYPGPDYSSYYDE